MDPNTPLSLEPELVTQKIYFSSDIPTPLNTTQLLNIMQIDIKIVFEIFISSQLVTISTFIL